MPRAIAWCGLVIRDETTEVRAGLQSFTKCVYISCVPGTGLCGSVLTPRGLWLSCKGARSPQNCVQDRVGNSPRGIRTQNIKRALDLGVGSTGTRPCNAIGWQCRMLGRWLNFPPRPALISLCPPFFHHPFSKHFLGPVLGPGLQWKYSDGEDRGPCCPRHQ